MSGDLADRIAANPFLVLGLPPRASRREIEREGQKLLGMLELGLAEAQTYPTPLGPRARTPELVRESMAELRDPGRRLAHELFFLAPTSRFEASPEGVTVPWPEAFAALGFGRWPSP